MGRKVSGELKTDEDVSTQNSKSTSPAPTHTILQFCPTFYICRLFEGSFVESLQILDLALSPPHKFLVIFHSRVETRTFGDCSGGSGFRTCGFYNFLCFEALTFLFLLSKTVQGVSTRPCNSLCADRFD